MKSNSVLISALKFARTQLTRILNRVPDITAISQIYGLVVMFIYGWSLYRFLWTIPSWLKVLTLQEIGFILAYTLVTDLFESIMIMAGFIILSIILPIRWFKDDFVVRAGMSVLYLLTIFILVAYKSVGLNELGKYFWGGIIGLLFLQILLKDVQVIRRFVTSLADRSTVFLYLSIPISIVALIILFIRGLIGIV